MKFLRWLLSPLKELAKSMACGKVKTEGDALKSRVLQALSADTPHLIDSIFDQWQNRLCSLVNQLTFISQAMKSAICDAIIKEGDKMQDMVKDAALKGGPQAVDKAFDVAEDALIARIKAL